jgi:hypothetical protein
MVHAQRSRRAGQDCDVVTRIERQPNYLAPRSARAPENGDIHSFGRKLVMYGAPLVPVITRDLRDLLT